ncbi:MAG: Smr/MutS family protein [Hyphomicrobiales bacterium]
MGKRESDEDEALWERVAKTAAPLKARKKNRIARAAPPPKPVPKAKAKSSKSEQAPAGPAPVKAQARSRPALQSGGLDRQTARKLSRGHLAVEARIDLHGMRQRDAHAALRKFLSWAVAKDYRHVLVITGKGARVEETKSFYETETRGVLRQAVPHWLSHGDLAPLIVSFAEAPRRLGGEGALYVRLRKWRTRGAAKE